MWHLTGTLTVQATGARTTLPLIMPRCSDNPAANKGLDTLRTGHKAVRDLKARGLARSRQAPPKRSRTPGTARVWLRTLGAEVGDRSVSRCDGHGLCGVAHPDGHAVARIALGLAALAVMDAAAQPRSRRPGPSLGH